MPTPAGVQQQTKGLLASLHTSRTAYHNHKVTNNLMWNVLLKFELCKVKKTHQVNLKNHRFFLYNKETYWNTVFHETISEVKY